MVEDEPEIGCAASDNPKYPGQVTYYYDDPSQFSRVVLFTTLPPMQIGARVLILEYLDRPSLWQRALLTVVLAGSIPRASDVLFVLADLKMFLDRVAAEHARTFRLFFDRTILLADMRVEGGADVGPFELHPGEPLALMWTMDLELRALGQSQEPLEVAVADRLRGRRGRELLVRILPASGRNRSPRRAAISVALRIFIRAAASSIARGNPSRPTQISATGLTVSSERTNAGMTVLARSAKSATAGITANSGSAGREARSGRPIGLTGKLVFPGQAQRNPAGHQDPQQRTGGEQRGHARGRAHDLFEVVQDEQQAPLPQVAFNLHSKRNPRRLAKAQSPTDRGYHQ